jgi:EmrB/QacA subfamily drug resistance transporter
MERRWKVLIVNSVAVFMALLDVTIVNIAFPDVRASFRGDSLADLSWVLNGYAVVFAAALIPAGRLADRFGRKRIFLAGVVVFLAASAACGLAGSVWMLVAARMVQGLGGAVLVPTSLSLILPEFPAEQRATATALWTATGAVAAAAGPSLGGLLVDWQGWRAVFFVNLFIGLPMLVPARRLLRESRDESAAGWPDLVGAVLLLAGVGALALAIVKGQDWGWGSVRVLATATGALVAIAIFVRRSAVHPRPVVDLGLFRIRSFAVASAGTFIFGVGFFGLLLCNVLFLTTAWHYTILHAGVALSPAPLAAAALAPLSGRLSDRYGQRVVAIPGNLLFGLGPLLLILRTGSRPDYWSGFLPAAIVAGMGVGLSLPAFGSAAVAELPRARFATGSAIASCFRQLGAVVGIAALVAVVSSAPPGDAMTAFHRAWSVVAASGLLAALISIALGRVRARDVATVEAAVPRNAELAREPNEFVKDITDVNFD